ncbi:hypothetical protein FBY31_1068 [Arthrobacter sp. SLBN-100]|nr:hypothetical protein FBY31_1068 [Arthrobacter sp. SLBN-100]
MLKVPPPAKAGVRRRRKGSSEAGFTLNNVSPAFMSA